MEKDQEKERELPTQTFVRRQFAKDGKDKGPAKDTDEVIQINRFATEPARVAVSMGMTVNLGNYESVRIDVSITVPCYFEEHEEAYSYARSWVEKRTLEEVNEARRFAQNRSAF